MMKCKRVTNAGYETEGAYPVGKLGCVGDAHVDEKEGLYESLG